MPVCKCGFTVNTTRSHWILFLMISLLFWMCCAVLCSVAQSCPTLCDPMDCSPPVSSVHKILQARILEWVAMPSSRGIFPPRDWTQVSCIVGNSLPSESPGKTKNTGVDSLSFIQGIFLTQESNQSLLHCRQILYLLSYQGSPLDSRCSVNVFQMEILLNKKVQLFFILIPFLLEWNFSHSFPDDESATRRLIKIFKLLLGSAFPSCVLRSVLRHTRNPRSYKVGKYWFNKVNRFF